MKIIDKKILGVIPARGGSKGIPHKNLYNLNGKTLISYTIESAKQSKYLTRFIVSTDSKEIAQVAKQYSASVPFIRPAELATDEALSVDVMKHAVLEMERQDVLRYEFLVMLQPTTPLRPAGLIDKVIEKLIKTGCDTVITMVDVEAYHPARMYRIENDMLINIMDERIPMRPRQELPSVYIRSGDVYASKRNVIFEKNSLIGGDCRPVIIPSKTAVNIDTIKDMILAEYYLKQQAEISQKNDN